MTRAEIDGLETRIKELRKAYWDGECTTPDAEYDALVEKLRSVEPNNPLLSTPEHGVMKGGKVVHKEPMLSLQKVYNKDDLMKWVESVSRSDDEEFLVQPKYDGISCHYDHGIWSTRGDGNMGENISSVCQRMCDAEKADDTELTQDDDLLGEIVIRKSVFGTTYRNVRRENGETFKNTRNAVAGILNADDFEMYARQNARIAFVDYNKYSFSMKKSEADIKWDIIKGVINSLDYPMDGIVVKIADRDWYDQQGSTSHHPKGAMAFKFENSSARTFLKSVDWGMGKEYITATAVFEPVNLGGVTVTRASIPMKSKTLPCIMDLDFNEEAVVTVERAGDVIPHITKIEKSPHGRAFSIDRCPFCGSPIEVLESGVKCTNPDCEQKKIHRLYEALVVLGVKNVGEATVSELHHKINGSDPTLYWWMTVVPHSPYTIAELDGYGISSARMIIDETKKAMHTTVAKFIAALGIPNVGIKIGREIEAKFTTVSNFANASTVDNLQALDGVGDIMAKRIREWVDNNYGDLLKLERLFTFEKPEGSAGTGSSNGKKTVCFTGAMRMTRSDMHGMAMKAGYIPVDSVTKSLDILVVADGVDLTSSKCVKAKKYGTEIMREDEFVRRCR